MITKKPRNNEGYYDLMVTDRDKNSFIMTVGGNFDLYWLPENHRKNRVFNISKEDEFTFVMFEKLFEAVRKNDDKYRPVLNEDTITYVSEDWPEEEANVLKIKKLEDLFKIEFVRNEDTESWSYPHIGCTICFCNSGSRVPTVESQFMRMFNFLAYECNLVSCEKDDNTM